MVQGLGIMVQGLGLRVQGLGLKFRVFSERLELIVGLATGTLFAFGLMRARGLAKPRFLS